MTSPIQRIDNASSAWSMFMPGVGPLLATLVLYVGNWVANHGAHPRLEEAKKVVAEIDRVMDSIPSHTREIIMSDNEVGWLAQLEGRHAKIRYDLNLLQERVLKANTKEVLNVWGKLVTELNQFVAEAKELEVDVINTSNRATTQYRQAFANSDIFVPADMLNNVAISTHLTPMLGIASTTTSSRVTAEQSHELTALPNIPTL